MNPPLHHLQPKMLSSEDVCVKMSSLATPLSFDTSISDSRSSWALNSRVHRLRKRHMSIPPPTTGSSCRRNNSSRNGKKKERHRHQIPASSIMNKKTLLMGQSRWETSAGPSSSLCSSTRASGRPNLPRRKKSIDDCDPEFDHPHNNTATRRGARLNKAYSDQPLPSYRHTHQTAAVAQQQQQQHGSKARAYNHMGRV